MDKRKYSKRMGRAYVSMNEKIQAYGEQQGVELGTTLTVVLFLTGNTRYLVKLDRAG